MKRKLIVLAFIISWPLMAQNEKAGIDQVFENAEKLKSGNYKDVLSSFLQLAAKNIVGEDKSVDFNSTLFALKLKANPDLTKDTDYARERFSRNLQLNFKANFDDDYKYTGFSGGVTWAAVNERDRLMANFADTALDKLHTEVVNDLNAFSSREIIRITSKFADNPVVLSQKLKSLKAAKDAILNNQKVNPADSDAMAYADSISSKKIQNLNKLADQLYAELESKPLLTFFIDGTSDKHGKFDRCSAGLSYLKGYKDADTELDIKAKFTYADTAAVSMPRTTFKATAGLNFIIGKKNSPAGTNTVITKSFFEIKAYLEYNAVYKNRPPGEEKQSFLVNADFRLRLTDDLWLPFTVKYDVENSNFLGFLNLTFNFGDAKQK